MATFRIYKHRDGTWTISGQRFEGKRLAARATSGPVSKDNFRKAAQEVAELVERRTQPANEA